MLIGLVGFIGIHGINYQNRIGDIANGIVTDAEYAQSCALRFIMYDQDQYYETNNAMKESGALRVSRAREMIAELIQVIAAAKDFSLYNRSVLLGKTPFGEVVGRAGLAGSGGTQRR